MPAPLSPLAIHVDRSNYDPEEGYEYHVCFSPNGVAEDDVNFRLPVEVAASIGETGELADLSFELPKGYRGDESLAFVRRYPNAQYVEPRIFVVFPKINGDTVIAATGRLEMDSAGRMIGMEITWSPPESD
ncbi:MAG TPA: hypothetical protein VG892_11420 [Terriglobales bacterium]|jgi:hypothetical protein|nr:hypothetical protein [Terriglobales bacterium]